MVTQDTMATVAAEFFQGTDWPDRVWRGLAILLDYMANREDLLALGMIEISAVDLQASARPSTPARATRCSSRTAIATDRRGRAGRGSARRRSAAWCTR